MSSHVIVASFGVRAVIADARRRQRRRRAVATAVTAIALGSIAVLALVHHVAAEPKVVKIYFSSSATSAQIAHTVAVVKTERGVAGVRLITKEAALADLKRRYPSLVAGVSYNPLPDSITMRVSGSDTARVIAAVKRALPAGIASVQGG